MSATVDRKQLAEELFDASLKALKDRIKSGEATAADFAAALKYAQHIGVSAVPGKPGTPAGDFAQALTEKLPFAGSEGSTH